MKANLNRLFAALLGAVDRIKEARVGLARRVKFARVCLRVAVHGYPDDHLQAALQIWARRTARY